MRGILLAGLLLALLAIPQPAKAACSALYRSFHNELIAMERGSGKCMRTLNSKSADAMQMCRICAPTIRRMIVLERMIRRNKSCFSSPQDKKSLRRMKSLQGDVLFMKRGCGL